MSPKISKKTVDFSKSSSNTLILNDYFLSKNYIKMIFFRFFMFFALKKQGKNIAKNTHFSPQNGKINSVTKKRPFIFLIFRTQTKNGG